MLDLVVLPGDIDQVPPGVYPHQITGPVDALRIVRVRRIDDKGSRCPLRIPVIAQGQTAPFHAQLAHAAILHRAVLLVQDHRSRVQDRLPDRERLVPVLLLIHHIGRTYKGLRGAIEVGIDRVREIADPVVQMLHRQHLAGEHHMPQVFRQGELEGIQVRDHPHSRGDPQEGGDLPFVHILHQPDRKAEI